MLNINAYLNIVAGILLIGASAGWYITDLKLDTARAELVAEKEGREVDKERYEAAQKEFEVKALREKQEIERRNRERAEEADASLRTLLDKYNAAIMRRAGQSIGSQNGGSNSTGETGSASGIDGPSSSAVVPDLMITYEDAEICAENTARLLALQKWYKETE